MNVIQIDKKSSQGRLIEWVARARSTDTTTRAFMTGVYITGAVAVATDGHRMHWAEPFGDLEDGLYTYATTKGDIVLEPDTEHTFPNWKRILPKDYKSATEYIALPWTKTNKGEASIQICKLLRDLDININFDYLFALSADKSKTYGLPDPFAVEISKDDKWQSRAIAFNRGDYHAIIMPMQRNDS